MKRSEYQKAFDSLSFSDDFQARTKALLHCRARELEREQTTMKFHNTKRTLTMAAAIAAVLAVTVSAAVLFLSPSDVARRMDSPVLAQAFSGQDAVAVNETKQVGKYNVTLQGLVSGKGLSDRCGSVESDRTYLVFALANADGTPLSELPTELAYTPLVKGYNIMAVNAWTLQGGYGAFEEDGVWYYLFDTQSIDIFADHTVYFAIFEGASPSIEVFEMHEDGAITMRPGAKGAMFTLPLDAAKADPAAARAFVENTGMDAAPMTDAQRAALEAELPDVHMEPDGENSFVILEGGEPLDAFTADEFARYVEDQKAESKRQLERGILSQATYDQDIADLDEALAAVRDGSSIAYRGENGYSLVTNPAVIPDGHQVSYHQTQDGIQSVIQ